MSCNHNEPVAEDEYADRLDSMVTEMSIEEQENNAHSETISSFDDEPVWEVSFAVPIACPCECQTSTLTMEHINALSSSDLFSNISSAIQNELGGDFIADLQ